MAVDLENAIDPLSKLDLWIKLRNGESLTLGDIPEIIRLRWPYFRDRWEFIKDQYIILLESSDNSEKLKKDIDSFSEFINSQRTSKNKKNPFDNNNIIYKFYYIFSNTPIDSIGVTYDELSVIKAKTEAVTAFNRADFIKIRDQLTAERDAIADRVQLSDSSYNTIYSRSPQSSRTDVRNKDINNMYELTQGINVVNYILANYFSIETATVDPFALAKSNANNPEIDIATYASGFLVKLNYGENLQSLAARTLGSPDKWIDIAIANGLKPPYIDEVGQKIMLISNGSSNQLNIFGLLGGVSVIDKFYIGQIVILQSDTQTFPEQRTVVGFKQIPVSNEIIIELSGDKNLDRYKVSENAHIRIYKPNTVNSSLMVLIPSTEVLPDDIKKETPWFLNSSDNVEKRQKIDLSIGESGDLVFNSNSDFQLVYGIENSIQAVKMKMAIEKGELKRHETYGLTSVVGKSNLDIDTLKNTLTESILTNIRADVRFAGLSSLTVDYISEVSSNKVTAFSITMVVKLAGSEQNIPISFKINI